MAKNSYTPLNLPASLVEEMKVWRIAFGAAYGRTVSYSEMIRGMLRSLDTTNPSVVEEMKRLTEKHPELMGKIVCSFREENYDDKHTISNHQSVFVKD